MPKSNQAAALEDLAGLVAEQNNLLRGVVVKLDLALELLGDPGDEALGNDPEGMGDDSEAVPPLDAGE